MTNFKKGGPLQNSNIFATNRLFVKNPLFKKRKKKRAPGVYNPTAKFRYDEGGPISFDYDDTLSTDRGLDMAQNISNKDKYIVSARDTVTPEMIDRALAVGISPGKIFATGSDKAKIAKVKELGAKHVDNKSSVVKALGKQGQQFKKGGIPKDISIPQLNQFVEGGAPGDLEKILKDLDAKLANNEITQKQYEYLKNKAIDYYNIQNKLNFAKKQLISNEISGDKFQETYDALKKDYGEKYNKEGITCGVNMKNCPKDEELENLYPTETREKILVGTNEVTKYNDQGEIVTTVEPIYDYVDKQPKPIIEDKEPEIQYEKPKLELKENKLPGFVYRSPEQDRRWIDYTKPTPFKKGKEYGHIPWSPYSAALRLFTGYDKGDSEKQLKEEIESAKEEGRPINFKGIPLMGKSDLKQRRSYKNAIKDYNEREKKLEEQNQKREDEYNKAMIEYNNYMLEEDAKRKASGLESDKYGGSILEYKRGGINSRSFSRSLEATNRFFAESKLFKKPKKLSKKRIYDPAAKYYQAGDVTYNNLPPTYLTALRNFVYPNVEEDPERAGYNSVNGTINYDSQSPIENMNNDWWREHEMFHHLQNQAGGMSTSGVVGQRPNPYVASDEAMQGYYDRRDADVERTIDSMIAQNPDLQFIPRHKLAEGAGPGFIGAEDLQYADPSTLEGEARQYEQYIKEGNPSIFPKKQNGGTNRTKLSNKEEQAFKKFYDTLPENLQTDDDTYDIRGYWDALGRPQEFDYTQPTEADGYYYGFSINPNTGEYLKSPAHPTFQHAIDEDRKIGYRPITNVYGRNIATEVPFIADPEEQSFLRNTEGPINYIELDLSPEEIEQYKKGGYIEVDIPEEQIQWYIDQGYRVEPVSKLKKFIG